MGKKRPLRPLVLSWLLTVLILSGGVSCQAAETPPPLTLADALKIAFENNLQLRITNNQVVAARNKLAQAKAGYYPKVSLSGGVSRFNEIPTSVKLGTSIVDLNNALDQMATILQGHNPGDPYYQGFANALSQQEHPDDSLTYYGLKLSLELPLYTGNKLEALNKQAQANLELAQANLETTERNLICDIKNAYYTVLYARQMVKTGQEAVRAMEEHLAEANSYFKAGLVPKLDVIRAEVKLADLRQKLLQAENSFDLAQSALYFTMGIDQGATYTFVTDLTYQPVTVQLQSCQDLALKNRSEIQAARSQVTMATQAVEMAKSSARPVVGLQAYGDTTKPYTANPSVGIGLFAKMSLYDGGLIGKQVAEVEAVLKQAEEGAELTERAIKLQVEQAFRNLQVAAQSIAVAERSLSQAEESVKMATVSYKAGLSTSLERIDAEVGLTLAKTNYIQALSMYNMAQAKLDKAMGLKEELK